MSSEDIIVDWDKWNLQEEMESEREALRSIVKLQHNVLKAIAPSWLPPAIREARRFILIEAEKMLKSPQDRETS